MCRICERRASRRESRRAGIFRSTTIVMVACSMIVVIRSTQLKVTRSAPARRMAMKTRLRPAAKLIPIALERSNRSIALNIPSISFPGNATATFAPITIRRRPASGCCPTAKFGIRGRMKESRKLSPRATRPTTV